MMLMQYYKGMLKQWGLQLIQRLETKLRRYHRPLQMPRKVELKQLDGETLRFTDPVFVLSTGRCGTLWLTKLLRLSKYVYVNHSDYPELIRHSRLAYESYQEVPQVFQEIVRATRDEFLLRAYRYGQCYVETNNRITFFAEAVKEVYPGARFIHLVRHPGDFVRSGLNRGWYQGHRRHDLGRIVDMQQPREWAKMSETAKIAWLWNETNEFIETFLSSLTVEEYIQIRAEDMFSSIDEVRRICNFVGIEDISIKAIRHMLHQQVNQQTTYIVEPYARWSLEQKALVARYVPLVSKYGYNLQNGKG